MKKLNSRHTFRKGPTVKELVLFVGAGLDSLGYVDRISACMEACENQDGSYTQTEAFIANNGLDRAKMLLLLGKFKCYCDCVVARKLADHLGEETLLEKAMDEVGDVQEDLIR